MSQWQPLGAILSNEFEVPVEAVEAALEEQRNGKTGRLGELLLQRKVINAGQLAEALARQFDLPFRAALPEVPNGDLIDRVPIAFAKDHRLFPISLQDGILRLAVGDPLDMDPLNDLAALTDATPELEVAPVDVILAAINRVYEQHSDETDQIVADMSGEESLDGGLQPTDLLDTSDEAPIIRFVNSMLTQAYKERASDIHLEPFETELIVRYRIDGILYEVLRPPFNAHASIISRIKILSGLNIAEKRLPQDGRFRVRIAGKDVDVRVSTLPTAFGERVVLRLLDKAAGVLGLEEIGMDERLLGEVIPMIGKSHGIFLVTGPTGSGKTTTLYAALSRLNNRQKNIITVEDPIEYQLAGVGQIQVNPKINLTFAAGLRSILRQDPDIIMVGEIRDGETAEIAVQSALTGHMVFSTLHTNDAAGALTRLVEMGVEPFLAASSIVGILAQRLVRSIGPYSREEHRPDPSLLKDLGLDPDAAGKAKFFRGSGCEKCLDIGYRGRTGVYELLPMNDTVRELLMQNRDASTIKNAAVGLGMMSLRQHGLERAMRGETTLEEVLRVTQEEG